jgi:colanic acid/amylovoran biosynthesis protein
MIRILVEPSDYVLRNAGDTAMLRVAVTRLSRLWPEATIRVFSHVPERFPDWAANARPLGTDGRRAWLNEPFLLERLPRAAPAAVRHGVRRIERHVRWQRPRLARRLLKASLRRRDRDPACIDAFFEAVEGADLVIANGMGGITDVFPEYARALLRVVQQAQRRGAITALMGQGLGPLDDDAELRALAASVLRDVDLIALRERRAGTRLLRGMGVDERRVLVTGDDAVEIAYRARPPALGDALGINLRAASYAGVNESTVACLGPALRRLRDELGTSFAPITISTVPGEEDAATVSRLLDRDVGSQDEPDLGRIFADVARCRMAVVGSYHAAVFALSMGVPTIGLYASAYYRDKFLGLADMFGDGCRVLALDVPDLGDRLAAVVRDAWSRADEHRPDLLASAEVQIGMAQAAWNRLRALVDSRHAGPTVKRNRARR